MRATAAAIAVLVAGVLAVEVGLRDPGPGLTVGVPVPSVLEPAVDSLRSQAMLRVDDPRAGAVASGVIFGRTDHVPPADEQAFLDSGLWHLLAASGQNIALVAACCVLLARAVGAGRTTGGVLALVAIPLYVLVVGGGASIVRAGIMGELLLVAWLAGRLADARHLLVVVAATICWTWPGAHRGLGMQLSFACVAALVTWAGPATRSLRDRGLPAWLAGGIAASLLCSVVTAPILYLRTGGAPLTGIVANVVAVPLAGGLLMVGLAGAVVAATVAAFGGPSLVAELAMWPAGVLASLLVRIAERAAALPAAQTTSPVLALGIPAAAGMLLAVHATTHHRVLRRRRTRILLVTVSGAALLNAVAVTVGVGIAGDEVAPPHPGAVRVAVLDVGQGDATLVASAGEAVLVDTGPPDGDVVRRVRAAGVERVDGIVLTHDSLDHRGGYDAALAGLDPDWIATPRAAPGPWQRIRDTAPLLTELCAGDALEVGDARIDVLHPPCSGTISPRTDDLHNDGAMVLLVTHGGVRVLLPADAEAPVLLDLGLPRLDVLRVSHHGSEDPALPELLARTTPDVAAISAGEGNEYGHPRRQVLDALDVAGVRTFRTDLDGTIVLDSDGRRVVRTG